MDANNLEHESNRTRHFAKLGRSFARGSSTLFSNAGRSRTRGGGIREGGQGGGRREEREGMQDGNVNDKFIPIVIQEDNV